MLISGKPPLEGLPRNSVVRINDHPNITSAVYHGQKASTPKKSVLLLQFQSENLQKEIYKI